MECPKCGVHLLGITSSARAASDNIVIHMIILVYKWKLYSDKLILGREKSSVNHCVVCIRMDSCGNQEYLDKIS